MAVNHVHFQLCHLRLLQLCWPLVPYINLDSAQVAALKLCRLLTLKALWVHDQDRPGSLHKARAKQEVKQAVRNLTHDRNKQH